MSKRVTTKMYRWRVIRLKKTPAAPIGTVDAPDRETAIKEAIKQYGIINPHHQQKLMAYRVS